MWALFEKLSVSIIYVQTISNNFMLYPTVHCLPLQWNVEMVNLLEKLFSRCSLIGIKTGICYSHTGIRIPWIITWCPGQFGSEWGKEIINSPSNNCVIVHAHINIYKTYCIANTCWRIENKKRNFKSFSINWIKIELKVSKVFFKQKCRILWSKIFFFWKPILTL